MEFFRTVSVRAYEEDIQQRIVFTNIVMCSSQIFSLAEPDESELFVGSIWGEFTLLRQVIRGGLRFALKEYPNALTRTITTGVPPVRYAMVIHSTINRKRKDPVMLHHGNKIHYK